jgi:HD-like signal output (HDOD) protein
MQAAAANLAGVTEIDWGTDPGPEAFERFYRQLTDRDELPTIPEVARHLTAAVNRDTTTAKQLAELIQRDQSLALKLLRLANSAFFSLRKPCTGITHAVTLLGFGTVRDLVMTLSLWGAIGDTDPTTRRRRKALWLHCATVGAAAKIVGKKVRGIDAGEALSAGLLHDIGKLLLGLRLGSTYWEMLDVAEETGVDTITVEQEAFGIHHGTVGKYLLQLWSLPEPLCLAVAAHHDPLEISVPVSLGQVVNASNRLVGLLTPEHDEEAGAILEKLEPGRLTADQWPSLRSDIAAEQQQLAGFFGDA